ncbi:hypothetical protein [Halobellus rufus]|uniref:hypothetical protein n=1 Tax=Halobellus rufus TaxID=1448860 RepID=UPI000679B59B|nr:hypothetical protein [Halobellus rufus]
MDRRAYLRSVTGVASFAALAGCISTGGGDGGGGGSDPTTDADTPTPTATATPTATPEPTSEFQGYTDEDPNYVDVQYRDYTEPEIEDIKEAAESPSYEDLFRNIDSTRGREVTYEGTVQQAIAAEDGSYFALFILIDGNFEKQTYVSWTGERFIQGDSVEFWGQVLGPETYVTGAGSQNTVPAIAAADMELLE